MNKSKIIFTFLKTGGGHFSPAKAVSDYISEVYPEKYNIILCDFFKDIGKQKKDTQLMQTFHFMQKFPIVTKVGHSLIKNLTTILQFWLHVNFKNTVQAAVTYIEKEKPMIVISTHSFTAYVLGKAKKLSHHPFTLITMSSDPVSSHVFIERLQNQDLFITSSDYSRVQLEKAGISPNNIRQFSYPVNRNFNSNLKASKNLIKKLSLNTENKTLLVSFGGQGVGNVEKFIKKVIKLQTPLNIIIVCGNNSNLKDRLKIKFPDNKENLIKVLPLGFVTNMHELIAVSDFCFIKPGPSTSFEIMLMKKPIIFYVSTAHIEDDNVDFAIENGVGIYAGKSVNKFIDSLHFILSQKGVTKFSEAYSALSLQNGAETVGEFLVKQLDH